MSDYEALRELGGVCGILPAFFDLQGHEHATTDETYRALLRAEGYEVETDADCRACLQEIQSRKADRWFPEEVIVRSDTSWNLEFGLGASWVLTDTANSEITAQGEPADFIALPSLPNGVYLLRAEVGDRVETVRILAAPDKLPSVHDVTGRGRIWGMTLALYGLTSERGTGLGTYADLGTVAALAGNRGMGFVGVNPVHNMGAAVDDAISPYSPSHRGFLNTDYIALNKVPGLQTSPQAGEILRDISAKFVAEIAADQIQHRTHKKTHSAILHQLFEAFRQEATDRARGAFHRFCESGGTHLREFADYEARAVKHGANWAAWTDDAMSENPQETEFHTWLQWVASEQLAQAQQDARGSGMGLGLYLDLAVGARRDGSEAWCERQAIAKGVSIGAPPDHLSPAGQNWNLAAFSPRRLQAENYAPLRRILAQTMRHAGVVRIDHVLGLNRSFWLPDCGAPGGYISQPFQSLLAIIKIEAARAGTVVIGEDLGLVPDGFRDVMRDNGFYGYSVLQYEKEGDGFRHPDQGSPQVLSCFATHDTPTLQGYAEGRDIAWWQRLGWTNAEQAHAAAAQRARDIEALRQFGNMDGTDANQHGLADIVHTGLARSHAAMVCVQLDDILDHGEAQNLPGTIHEHPNWRRKYDVTVQDLTQDQRLVDVAEIMAQAGRGMKPVH